MILTFAVWYASEKTLSIHSIFTMRREAFYWLTILFTFALGTASGDLMAESLGLGYLVTGIIICAVIASVMIAWRLKLDAVLSFWLAYIMTRPLGASLGDYLSQPQKFGGLGLGATVTSVIFVSAIVLTVIFLSITRRDMIPKPSGTETVEPMRKNALMQVVAVVLVLGIAGGAGYYWRQSSLQNETNTPTAQAQLQQGSSTADPQASPDDLATADPQSSPQAGSPDSTPQASSPAGSIDSGAKNSKLGDVTDLVAIEEDTLGMVNKGDMAAAKTRIDDLEYTWDNSEAHLKPKDPKKWTEIDKTIDAVLRQLRAVNQDVTGCKSALMTSLDALKS